MTAEQWLLVKDEFEKTRLLSPELRQRAVTEIEDQEVQREVEELLQAHSTARRDFWSSLRS